MLNGLDLFSGIGGITLALAPWVRPVAYCENDRYAQSVLLSRMAESVIPLAPIWDDVRTLDGSSLPEIDIISGGFPCQDISSAGPGKGLEGERSGLYWEMYRLIGELKPRFVFLENVPFITSRGGCQVVESLTAIGYDCRWTILPAAAIGAAHLRKRWFLLAHHNGKGLEKYQGEKPRREQWERHHTLPKPIPSGQTCPIEAVMDRAIHGVPYRAHRIKCLGNSVVPLQARTAFMRLMGLCT